ncbi:hypothetical protein VOLCADRAFT_104871 [Volvox carteri f. nagariensis]|uniref:CHRD domain-containing protein n=1 Tax=Volvox carteri f. nagariensis TaxID=3068 RepID=D8TWN2_VOLCA|nr:uncharacterized protein VOLCADRAFT_104871 [Volvox carteri f. nagariensis]EFJ48177.1 hypothetical protein VOLCADRAFT_104871 [Volvox carteri f. nagariensis]|eukprot:XP_002950862.1 hypothetical protein VOLCADRAFT_104871 [Volvox carteri f. nagariensis]
MMKIHAFVLTLVVLVLAVGVAKADTKWPNAPYGSIVAVANLSPVDKSLIVRGSVAMVWPRPGQGPANVTVNMTGALSQMTMAHIHLVWHIARHCRQFGLGLAPHPMRLTQPRLGLLPHLILNPFIYTSMQCSNSIIHNATGKPIRLDLLPVLNGTRPMPLNPPLSFRGIISFTAPLTTERVAAWDPDNNHMNFIEALQQGLLYVNVHSVGFPAGALQGKLLCKDPCMFSIGGGVVNPGGH